ncbi:unnamed protein product [Thelazia callipaeda]|uniref:Indoleamine 2,3-dioxygenase 2 n=1 Tax=Thelazia callipaeda TaxID=103827 RepID=A0A0N5D5I0_THECL|nr:unnamed protein product [Thelazia callipaeda]
MNLDQSVVDLLTYFEIDQKTGFLIADPLIKLPEAFEQWHQISDNCHHILLDNMEQLIAQKLLNHRIEQLPVISTDSLTSNKELRLAHLLLVTLAAGYIWQDGLDKARLSVPASISIPLLEVCKRLSFKPIACHASVCLANWRPIRESESFDAAAADIIAFRFVQHPGNRWFFTLTAQIEAELAEALCAIASACWRGEIEQSTMLHITNAVKTATATMKRMEDYVPPDVFYHGFRIFLSGYTTKPMVEQGGIIFEGRQDLGPQLLNGGSAAQSSTFHVIDGFLGIKHSYHVEEFLALQREYMPPKHRDFILWVRQSAAKILNLKYATGYYRAVQAVRKFRESHIKMESISTYCVEKFIVLPAEDNCELGTGGSSFMDLLKSIASDCQHNQSRLTPM